MAGYDPTGAAIGCHRARGTGLMFADIDVERTRRHTPDTANVAHLDNAGATLPPRQVTGAVIADLHREAAIGRYEAASAAAQQVEHTYARFGRLLASTPTSILGRS